MSEGQSVKVEFPMTILNVLMPEDFASDFIKLIGTAFALTGSQIKLPEEVFITDDKVWRITVTIFKEQLGDFLDALRRFCSVHEIDFEDPRNVSDGSRGGW